MNAVDMTARPWPGEIIGQEQVLEYLSSEALSARRSHAYLFQGPAGVGKRCAALHFARILHCSARAKPCGTCKSCRAHGAQNHPDFDLVAPPEGKRNIPIESVRNLLDRLALKPVLSSGRAVVVDEAHLLTEEAANAILKTLEEPPDGAVLVLVTDRPATLPETVLSRCRPVRFRPVGQADCRRFLENAGIREDAGALAALASGSPASALRAAAGPVFGNRRKFAEILLRNDPCGAADRADEIMELSGASGSGGLEAKRKAVIEALELMAFISWEAARTGWGAQGRAGSLAEAAGRSRFPGPARWRAATLRIAAAAGHVRANVTPSLALDAAMGDLCRMLADLP